jgi:hypothetical protein
VKCPYCSQLVYQLLSSKMIIGNQAEMEQYDYINNSNSNQNSNDFLPNGMPESEMQSNTGLGGGTSLRPLGANAHSMEEAKSGP